MWFSKKHTNFIALLLCLGLFLIFTMESAMADNTPDVRYKNGLLSLIADKTPLLAILKGISVKTGIDVFVSKDFVSEDVSIQFADKPLEAAVKKVLKRYNNVIIYQKENSSLKISAIKVYPMGKSSGSLMSINGKPLYSNDRAITADEIGAKQHKFSSTSNILFRSNRVAGQSGLLVTEPYVDKHGTMLAKSFGKRFEIKEQKAFAEINDLKKRINLTENVEKKQALNLVLMHKLEAFEKLKSVNQNRMEAIHRIELFENNKKNITK